MKKLGLFAMLGCLVTVGGVYATWIYSTASAGSISESIVPTMAGVGEASKKGTISVDTGPLYMTIDNAGNYVPELLVRGNILVAFSPSIGADSDVIENGIKLTCTLSVTDPWMYDSDFDGTKDKPFFTLDANPTFDVAGGAFVKDAVQIPAQTIADLITFNVEPGFVLDTRAKYENFKECLNQQDSKFTVTVSEKA